MAHTQRQDDIIAMGIALLTNLQKPTINMDILKSDIQAFVSKVQEAPPVQEASQVQQEAQPIQEAPQAQQEAPQAQQDAPPVQDAPAQQGVPQHNDILSNRLAIASLGLGSLALLSKKLLHGKRDTNIRKTNNVVDEVVKLENNLKQIENHFTPKNKTTYSSDNVLVLEKNLTKIEKDLKNLGHSKVHYDQT